MGTGGPCTVMMWNALRALLPFIIKVSVLRVAHLKKWKENEFLQVLPTVAIKSANVLLAVFATAAPDSSIC